MISYASRILTVIEVSNIVDWPSEVLIVHILQGINDNAEGAEKLQERVYTVTLVVVTSLQGKDEDDIPMDMKNNMEKLLE